MRGQNTKHKVLGNVLGGERERAVILICFWLVLKLEIAGSHDLQHHLKYFSSRRFLSREGFKKYSGLWQKSTYDFLNDLKSLEKRNFVMLNNFLKHLS